MVLIQAGWPCALKSGRMRATSTARVVLNDRPFSCWILIPYKWKVTWPCWVLISPFLSRGWWQKFPLTWYLLPSKTSHTQLMFFSLIVSHWWVLLMWRKWKEKKTRMLKWFSKLHNFERNHLQERKWVLEPSKPQTTFASSFPVLSHSRKWYMDVQMINYSWERQLWRKRGDQRSKVAFSRLHSKSC